MLPEPGGGGFDKDIAASVVAGCTTSLPVATDDASIKGKEPKLVKSVSEAAFNVPGTTREAEEKKVICLRQVALGAAQNQGQRAHMEDAYTMIPSFTPPTYSSAPKSDSISRTFAGVYDGHASDNASRTAADRLHAIIAQDPAVFGPEEAMGSGGKGAIETALVRAFKTMDREILEALKMDGDSYGTTAVIVLRVDEVIYVAHAGDSGAILIRDGKACRLTQDHKPSVPKERERIESRGGEIDEARDRVIKPAETSGEYTGTLAMSRALGDPDYKPSGCKVVCGKPDVSRTQLRPGDSAVLIASDGLWDVLGDQQAGDIVQAIISRRPPKKADDIKEGGHVTPPHIQLMGASGLATTAADAVVQAAIDHGTGDNVTAVVMLLNWE